MSSKRLLKKQIESLDLIGEGGYAKIYADNEIVYRVLKDLRGFNKTKSLYSIYCDHNNLITPVDIYMLGTGIIVEILPRAMGTLHNSNKLILSYDIKTIYLDIAKALEHLHSNGIMHNDIKETNVLLYSDKAVLADLDLVSLVNTGECYYTNDNFLYVSHARGTPPEFRDMYYQDNEVPIMLLNNTASDLWSFGMMMVRTESNFNWYEADVHTKTQDALYEIIDRELSGSIFIEIIKSLLKSEPSERLTASELVLKLKNIIEY